MIRFAKFLQLFGMMLMPAALMMGFSGVPHAGEIELTILFVGMALFGAGRLVENRVVR